MLVCIDWISFTPAVGFVLFCFPKKVTKKGAPQSNTPRLRVGSLIKLLCYCGFPICSLMTVWSSVWNRRSYKVQKTSGTLIKRIKQMVADKRIGVKHITFNPKQSEALPIRPLSVYSWAKRKNGFPFIRVIRVPILAVLPYFYHPSSSKFISMLCFLPGTKAG